MPTTIDDVKHLAAGRWVEILSRLGGLPESILDGRHHPCPKCQGTDRFRLIDMEAGACLCNQCFHDHNGDGLAALQWLNGWTFAEAATRLAEFLGTDPPKIKGAKVAKKSAAESGVYATVKDAVRAAIAGLAAKHRDANPAERDHPKPVKAWRYDTFVVVRIDLPTPPGEKRRKEFRPVSAVALSDGRTAYRLGYPPGKRPLYRRAELAATTIGDLVVVCGGEKATDAAAGLGLTSTTCAGGEKAVRETDWSPLARFSQVVVAIDNDPAGHEYGALVSAECAKLQPVPAVRILLLPDLPPKGDIVEWISAGGTRERFLELATAAPPPDPIAHDRAICEAIQIDVLGELPDRKIKVFSEVHGKTVEIQRVAFLTYTDMLQSFGPVVRERISPAKDAPPGMISVERAKEAIAVVGGSERAGAGIEKGLGVWPGEDGRIVLVGPGRAAVWDGSSLTIHRRPRVAGIKVDLDHPAETKWFCSDKLAKYLESAAEKTWCLEAIDRLTGILTQWNWKIPAGSQGTVAEILAGLVLATWVQTAWSWRPMVGITAASDSGKSTLFEQLEILFGPLSLLNSKSTEAGIRQAVANHAKVILCDEFENDSHRQKILEYFRTASKGSKTYRGTTSQRSQEFGLQHIAWVTAVELGLRRAPDRNRFVILELAPPPAAQRGKLSLPSVAELKDLGQRLLAIAVRYVAAGERCAGRLKQVQVDGIHGRVIESLATPVGMLAAVLQTQEDCQESLLRACLAGLDTDPVQAVKDETDLLGEILSCLVRLGRGEEATVGQLLIKPEGYAGAWDALERVGVTVTATATGRQARELARTDESRRDGIFLAHNQVARELLGKTRWAGQSIDQILKRLPGAKRVKAQVGGHQPWGIKIPWSLLKEKYLAEPEAEF